MRNPLRFLTLAAALAMGVAPATAQTVSSGQTRGWIGVSFELVTNDQGAGARTVVTVTDVIEGGPAHQAGVRPGDVVVTVNGRNWENQFSGVALHLRPGDPVRMVVERDGRRRELVVTAAPRPTDVAVAPQSLSFTFRTDSMVDRMYRAMDSLRIRLIREDDGSLSVVGAGADSLGAVLRRLPDGGVRARTAEPGRVVAVAPWTTVHTESSAGVMVPEVRPPFAFFIFRGEAYDSLRSEMDRLNQEIRDARSQQAVRTRELARRTNDGRIDRNDAELRRLDERLRHLDLEASALRSAMEKMSFRAASERFDNAFFEVAVPPASEAPPVPDADLARARPLAPYVLGQNRAAGAEVVDLRPELAAYFQVAGGVLVVNVPDGTPAALAGLQPGDVVIRVDGREVRSIMDLREGLAGTAAQLPLTLVRKGKEVQVLLRR